MPQLRNERLSSRLGYDLLTPTRNGWRPTDALPAISPRPVSPYSRRQNDDGPFPLFAHGKPAVPLPSQLKKSAERLDKMEDEQLPYPPQLHSPITNELPDDVIQHVFTFLPFKAQCRLGAVCSCWRLLATKAMRAGYSTLVIRACADGVLPVVRDLRPLSRLHVELPLIGTDDAVKEACDAFALSILRRLASSVDEMALDWSSQQYVATLQDAADCCLTPLFTNVKSLTLILRVDKPNVVNDACLQLGAQTGQVRSMHLQIHENPLDCADASMAHLEDAVSALKVCRADDCALSVELHCSDEGTLLATLRCFAAEKELANLKIISCSDTDERGLSIQLSSVLAALEADNGRLTVKHLGLRGVHLRNERTAERVASNALVTSLRLSSCNIDAIECLSEAIASDSLKRLEIFGNDALIKYVYDKHFTSLCTTYARAHMDFRSPERVYHCSEVE